MIEYNLDLNSNVEEVAKAGASAVDELSASLAEASGASETTGDSMEGADTASTGAGESFATTANQAADLALKVLDAAAAFMEFATAAGEARLSAVSSLEVMLGGQEAAENTYSAIVDVTRRVAISQQDALAAAAALDKAGERNGNRMVQGVESIAKAEAARAGAGDTVQGILERTAAKRDMGYAVGQGFSITPQEIKAIGLTYNELAQELSKQTGAAVGDAEMQLRTGAVGMDAGLNALHAVIDSEMGEIADKKFNTVTNQAQRLQDTFSRLFEDVNSSMLGEALADIVDLFDETTVTGAALKSTLMGFFNGLGSIIKSVVPYFGLFISAVELMYLETRIALWPLEKIFRDVFGGGEKNIKHFEDGLLTVSDSIKQWGEEMKPVFEGMTPLIQALKPLLMGVAYALGLIAKTGLRAVVAMAQFNNAVVKAWDGVVAFTAEAYTLGSDLVDGLVKGITDGAIKVADAMKGVGKKALGAFKDTMGIHSPSRVMMEQGEFMGEGLQMGIESESANTDKALASIVRPDAAAGSVSTNNSKQSSASVVFQPGAIQIQGVENAEELETRFPQLMAETFERIGLSVGAEVPA